MTPIGAARVTDCIFWGNADSAGVDEFAQRAGDQIIIEYSCAQGWTGNLGGGDSHEEAPLFVPGPVGCYYLSQTDAADPEQSSCVDAGSGTTEALDLDVVTTRRDEDPGVGIAHLGHHYPRTGELLILGDFDRDSDVDSVAFGGFQRCFTGSEAAGVAPCCRIFDPATSQGIDLDDFAELWPALAPKARAGASSPRLVGPRAARAIRLDVRAWGP